MNYYTFEHGYDEKNETPKITVIEALSLLGAVEIFNRAKPYLDGFTVRHITAKEAAALVLDV